MAKYGSFHSASICILASSMLTIWNVDPALTHVYLMSASGRWTTSGQKIKVMIDVPLKQCKEHVQTYCG